MPGALVVCQRKVCGHPGAEASLQVGGSCEAHADQLSGRQARRVAVVADQDQGRPPVRYAFVPIVRRGIHSPRQHRQSDRDCSWNRSFCLPVRCAPEVDNGGSGCLRLAGGRRREPLDLATGGSQQVLGGKEVGHPESIRALPGEWRTAVPKVGKTVLTEEAMAWNLIGSAMLY